MECFAPGGGANRSSPWGDSHHPSRALNAFDTVQNHRCLLFFRAFVHGVPQNFGAGTRLALADQSLTFVIRTTSRLHRDPSMPSLRRLSRSLASALALSALAAGVVARGELLTYNLNDPRDGMSFVDSSFPQRAQVFSTTTTGTHLGTIRMDILNIGPSSAAFSIKIYSYQTGVNDSPGNVVATLFTGTGGDIPSASLFTLSGLSVDLASNTQYFLVMENGDANFWGGWAYNNETTGSGSGFSPTNSYSQTTINNWQGISGSQPYRMEIIAVPEPPAIVLSGIGLASALYAFRRRRG